MKTIWNRFKYSVQADLHTMFDKQEAKNPIAMLNQYIREAEKQTASIGKLLERQATLKTEFEKECQEAQEITSKRKRQLELAQQAGVEDLIAFATKEIITYEARVTSIKQSIHETREELIALEGKFEEMKHKVKDMKMRQLQLMGKENATRAHHRMDQVISPDKANQQMASFNEMNQYIHHLGRNIDRAYETSTMERRLESLTEKAVKNNEVV